MLAPEGAYYILADFSALSDLSDADFAVWLSREAGVTPVPGSSFYHEPAGGRSLVRFVFCKTDDILHEAARRLAAMGIGNARRETGPGAFRTAVRSGFQS